MYLKTQTFIFLIVTIISLGNAGYPAGYPPKDRRITGFACENSFITLRCTGKGERIRILRANYGRFSLVICNQGGVSKGWDLNCVSMNSTEVVEARCGGRSNCTVFANNKEFGDPCRGTKKYIEIRYFCEKAQHPTTTKEIDTPGQTTTASVEVETTFQIGKTTTVSKEVSTKEDKTVIVTTPSPGNKTTTKQSPWSSTPSPSITTKHTGTKTCAERESHDILWPVTEAKQSVEKPCPQDLTGVAVWYCGKHGKWVGKPDMSGCVSPWMEDIEEMLKNDNEVDVALETLNTNLEDKRLGSGDLKKAAVNILPGMVQRIRAELATDMPLYKRREKVHRFSKKIVKSGSSLLGRNQKDSWESLDMQQRKRSATSLIVSLERMAQELASTIDSEEIVTSTEENIVMEVSVLKMSQQKSVKLPRMQNDKGSADHEPHFNLPLDGISALVTEEKLTVMYLFYNNLDSLMSPEDSAESAEANSTSVTRLINSNVISASVSKHSMSQSVSTNRRLELSKPMTYTVPLKQSYTDREPVCAFWVYNESTLMGKWSDEGCHVVMSTDKFTTCECNHLTNFAVLMDVTGTKIHKLHQISLQAITYVGCTVSIVCLVMCLVSFSIFRNLQSDRNTIHKNLVLCLLLAELLFLFGIGQTQDKIFCSVIAGFLHFFFLASFSWMCLEGIQLYFMLIVVFEAERYKWFYGFGYGVPAVIVAISAAVDHTGYGTDFHCWLKTENHFILSFVVPAAVVILINIVMLSIAVHTMCRHAGVTARKKGKLEKMGPCDVNSKHDSVCDCEDEKTMLELPTWLKGSAVLVVLLGLTWTFGLMYVNEDTIVMAYLFTILNSLQGLFIFIFHCFMDKKVKKEWRRAIYKAKWLPMCCRVNIGGTKDTMSSPTPSYSSGIQNYFLRFWSSRKRKRSSSNSATAKNRRSDLDSFLRTDSSSGCTTGTALNRYSNQSDKLLPNGQNVYTALPTHHEGGVIGELSVIDCSVVDSENVTEYCQQQLNVSNEKRRYSSGSEDIENDVQDNESRDSTSRHRLSFLSTDSNLKITSEFNSDNEDGKVNYAVIDCDNGTSASKKPQPTEKEQNLINDILNLYENTKDSQLPGDPVVSSSQSETDEQSESDFDSKGKKFTQSAPDLKQTVHSVPEYSNPTFDMSKHPLLGSLPDVSIVGEIDIDSDSSPYSKSADGRIKQ